MGQPPTYGTCPTLKMHLLDTGHFALGDQLDVMAAMIRSFLDKLN